MSEEIKQNKALLLGITIIFLFGITNGFYLEWLRKTSIPLLWAQDIIHFVVVPIFFLVYISKLFPVNPSDYGLISASPSYPLYELVGASIFTAFLFGLILWPMDNFLYYVFYAPEHAKSGNNYSSIVPTGIFKLPVVFYLAITAGMVEEIVYRGIPHKLIFENKKIVMKNIIYILCTSVAFSAIHWDKGLRLLFGTFIFGILAGWLYLKLRNLWPLVGGHFLYDFYIFW